MTTLIATKIYTTVTFAPVQGFIEKSRKLRDLYGSSFILSYLAWCICLTAESKGHKVISPALPNVTQGMPNQIIVEGAFAAADAEAALNAAWQSVVVTCKIWIENQLPTYKKWSEGGKENYGWERAWTSWKNHTWEFFCIQGKPDGSVSDVRKLMNEQKCSRNWVGVNWTGDSSTLSGSDGICCPGMDFHQPKTYRYSQKKDEFRQFYQDLSEKIGEAYGRAELGKPIIDVREELSIPELIKRLVTIQAVNSQLIPKLKDHDWWQSNIVSWWEEAKKDNYYRNVEKDLKILRDDLNPETFRDFNRKDPEQKRWQGWFLGDGDNAAKYMKSFAGKPNEAEKITEFSGLMREWGENFKQHPPPYCRVVYAGGDDFMGIFHRPPSESRNQPKPDPPLSPSHCVQWFSSFKSEIWNHVKSKPITVSVGFVWAAPDVPQREVLQHCREAESDAKSGGRDRIALRVLFNSGNHLQWICPWRLLKPEQGLGLLESYRDRGGARGYDGNWTHFYNDVATLEARRALTKACHASTNSQTIVALGLLEIYFPDHYQSFKNLDQQWNIWNETQILWNVYDTYPDSTLERLKQAGILGDRRRFKTNGKNNGTLDPLELKHAIDEFNEWIINLAKAGFHLCSTPSSSSSP
jgi:CRISPR-associated protein Cmr2